MAFTWNDAPSLLEVLYFQSYGPGSISQLMNLTWKSTSICFPSLQIQEFLGSHYFVMRHEKFQITAQPWISMVALRATMDMHHQYPSRVVNYYFPAKETTQSLLKDKIHIWNRRLVCLPWHIVDWPSSITGFNALCHKLTPSFACFLTISHDLHIWTKRSSSKSRWPSKLLIRQLNCYSFYSNQEPYNFSEASPSDQLITTWYYTSDTWVNLT
jgi:hypothetical protein